MAPEVSASSNGLREGSIAPPGVDFVLKPSAERGEV